MNTQEQVNSGKTTWEKPELAKLGTIRDIAQRASPVDQANQNKKS